MDGFVAGRRIALQVAQAGSLAALPELPQAIDADSTATYIRAILDGRSAVPAPVAAQVEHILHLVRQLEPVPGAPRAYPLPTP